MERKPDCESCQRQLIASEARRSVYMGDLAAEATYLWFKEAMKDCIAKNTCLPLLRLKTKLDVQGDPRKSED